METQNLACVTGGCRCFKITMPEKVSNLKNADRCMPTWVRIKSALFC